MTTTFELTLAKANELLDAAVAEKGAGYVYTNPKGNRAYCLYVHGDEPGCIVGNVLNRLGVPLEELFRAEGNPASYETLLRLGVVPEPYVADLLLTTQSHQDGATPWGDAVTKARREVAELIAFHAERDAA